MRFSSSPNPSVHRFLTYLYQNQRLLILLFSLFQRISQSSCQAKQNNRRIWCPWPPYPVKVYVMNVSSHSSTDHLLLSNFSPTCLFHSNGKISNLMCSDYGNFWKWKLCLSYIRDHTKTVFPRIFANNVMLLACF